MSVHPAQSRWCPGSVVGSLCGRTPGLEAVWRPEGGGSGRFVCFLCRFQILRNPFTFSMSKLQLQRRSQFLNLEKARLYLSSENEYHQKCHLQKISSGFNYLRKDLNKMYACLLIRLGSAETKDEQMAMGVCASKTMPIGGEFAVENGSMTLALNLDDKHKITPGTGAGQPGKMFVACFFFLDPGGPYFFPSCF